MKTCSKCNEDKNLDQYYIEKGRPLARCKTCTIDVNNQYQKNNKEKVRNRHYKREYGIDLEAYNSLFVKQSGYCLICFKHQRDINKPLRVDHCHSTGVVRGLLCDCCNMALGLLNDNKEHLKNAIKYLDDKLDWKINDRR